MITRWMQVFVLVCLWPGVMVCQQMEWYGVLSGNADSRVGINTRQTDRAGNLIIGGAFTKKVDFDFGPGVHEVTADEEFDLYVAKYSPYGDLIWLQKGSQSTTWDETIYEVAIDSSGNTYASGYEWSPEASIVMKLNSNGQVAWKKYLSFMNYHGEQVSDAVIVSTVPMHDGGILVQGVYSDSTDFDPGPGKYIVVPDSSSNVFFLKLDANGNFKWVKSLGGIPGVSGSRTEVRDIKITDNGNFIVWGGFTGHTDMDLDTGSHLLHSTTRTNLFLAEYSADMKLVWVKQFAGAFYEISFGGNIRGGMDLAPADTIYVLSPCISGSVYDPEGDSIVYDCSNYKSLYLLKISPDGHVMHHFGIGKGATNGIVAAFKDGSFVVSSSSMTKGDLDPRPEGAFYYEYQSTQGDFHFFAKYDSHGRFLWAQRATQEMGMLPLIPDSLGNIYLTGSTSDNLYLYADGPNPLIDPDPAQTVAYIVKYRVPVCDSLEEDYMIGDFTSDTGLEPNPINLPSWKSPYIRINSSLSSDFDPGGISYGPFSNNYIKIKVKKVGCNASSSAKLGFYYSLEPTGMVWPDAWNNYPLTIFGDTIVAGNKFGEVTIPELYLGDTWEGIIRLEAPVDPDLFPSGDVNIGLLGKIESNGDPDTYPPTGSLIEYIHNNNNLAWRIVKLR